MNEFDPLIMLQSHFFAVILISIVLHTAQLHVRSAYVVHFFCFKRLRCEICKFLDRSKENNLNC